MKPLLLMLVAGTCLFSIASCRGQRTSSSDQLLKNEEHTVIFLGNSIVEAWPRLRPGFFEGRPWAAMGIPGQLSSEILDRFSVQVFPESPKVVIIMAGTNDMISWRGFVPVAHTAENIYAMAAMADSAGIIPVICAVLPINSSPFMHGNAHAEGVGADITARITALNQMLRIYAEQHDWAYIDHFQAMADERQQMKEHLSDDGIHPNQEGYAVMEGLVEAVLTAIFRHRP